MPEKDSYRQIIKSTGLFGGVQFIQILATVLRGKIIAVFLGSAGMGITSLLVSSIAMLQSVSDFGLSYSAIRNISQAHESGDTTQLSKSITIFLKLVLLSAVFGTVLLIVLSPLLSQYVFGNNNYTQTFICLSSVVFISTFSTGYLTILRGTRKLKEIALATTLSAILSVVVSFPFFYYLRIQGIIPALIVGALSMFVLNYYFYRKIEFKKISLRISDISKDGREMAKLGFIMMLVGVLSTSVPFIINAFIKINGSLSDVGLYQAGLSLTARYIGLVFTAMAVDYFPRISAIHSENAKVRLLANQQSEIMLLIITPLLIALIIYAPLLVKILLASEFIPAVNFIRLASIGYVFQAASHPMGLISFAKGDKKTFLILGIVGNTSLLLFSLAGYYLYGLDGIGALFIIHCIMSYILVFGTAYIKYDYRMSPAFSKFLFFGILSVALVYIIISIEHTALGYIYCNAVLLALVTYSFQQINRRVSLKQIYVDYFGGHKVE